MTGTIVWWSPAKQHGAVSVIGPDGTSTRYFLLQSRILSAPQVIKAGQFVKFASSLTPSNKTLLPVALGVVISETAFKDGE